VLSKLAYLTLCRSIQVLVLLVRGDGTKDLEILVLPLAWAVCPLSKRCQHSVTGSSNDGGNRHGGLTARCTAR
jgi:hypothetical protein